MFRHYKDKRIYRNLKISLSTSIISFCVIFIILIYFLIARYGMGYELNQILFVRNIEEDNIALLFFSLLLFPFGVVLGTRNMLKIYYSIFNEKKFNNDYANTLTEIIFSFMPLVLYIFLVAINPKSNYGACLSLVSELHMPIYVACGFLIQNCVLIKREWKENPPDFVRKEQAEKEQQKAAKIDEQKQKKSEQDIQLYLALIEKCGIGFFIKYYRQISRLPLKDVNVTESYSSAEREERLLAAKKIINLGLSELALSEIIRAYNDILDKEVIDLAKELLAEIRKPD